MLVLASQSASRKAMLEAAGVEFEPCPAHVDERAIEAALEIVDQHAGAVGRGMVGHAEWGAGC